MIGPYSAANLGVGSAVAAQHQTNGRHIAAAISRTDFNKTKSPTGTTGRFRTGTPILPAQPLEQE